MWAESQRQQRPGHNITTQLNAYLKFQKSEKILFVPLRNVQLIKYYVQVYT